MARVRNVIEAKVWRNTRTGQGASIYGALPWTNRAEASEWKMENVGYTWQMNDGTVGLGRRPVATLAEAIDIMEQVNSL